MSSKTEGINYMEKIGKYEPVFILRGQDISAPRAVLQWIVDNFESAPPHRLEDAFECAMQMREHKERKQAD